MKATIILRVGVVFLTLTLLCPSANGQLTILTKAGQLASKSEWYKFLRPRPVPPPTRPHEVTSSVLLNGQIISRQFGLLDAKGITVLERSKDVVRPQLSTFSPDVSQLVPFTSAITEQKKAVCAKSKELSTSSKILFVLEDDGLTVEEKSEIIKNIRSESGNTSKTSSQPVKAEQDNEHLIQSSIRGEDVEGNLPQLQNENIESTQVYEEATNSDGIQNVEQEDFESDPWWNSIYDLIKTTMPNLKVHLEAETNTYSLLIYDYGYQYEDAA